MNMITLTGIKGLGWLAIVYAIFVFLVHVILALAVNKDAKHLRLSGSGLFLVGPFLWGWIVFIFGIAGIALYWAIHHSTLRNAKPPEAR